MAAKRIAYILPEGDTASLMPEDVLSDDVVLDVVRAGAFLSPVSPTEHLITEVATAEAAMRARDLGYDGVLVSTDYGLAAIRAALDVPVVGCSQAAVLTALSLARRFSFVTIWPRSTQFVNRGVLERTGAVDRCASIRHVSREDEQATLAQDDNFYTQMLARRDDMLDRIVAEIDAAVVDDGAEAIVLGCNCMTSVAPLLAERSSVPVIDATRTGYAYLSMLLQLGLTQSAAAAGTAAADRAPVFAAMVDGAAAALRAAGEEEACEVCVLGDPSSCVVPEPAQPAAGGA